jgi:hypothetical protein
MAAALCSTGPAIMMSFWSIQVMIVMFMHMRWQAAGNLSQLAIYPGGIHAFNAFPIELARNANATINKFIKDAAK